MSWPKCPQTETARPKSPVPLTTTNPPKNSITLTELLHNRLEAVKYKKGMFLSPNPNYSYFSEDLMIRSSETVKIPDIGAFF